MIRSRSRPKVGRLRNPALNIVLDVQVQDHLRGFRPADGADCQRDQGGRQGPQGGRQGPQGGIDIINTIIMMKLSSVSKQLC